MKTMNETLTTEEFDRLFDEGKEDITPYLDMSSARRINRSAGKSARANSKGRRVNVDMSAWMIDALDKEAERLNISRQAVIKSMLDDQLRARGFMPV
mgnify:FL=1